jgi:hypothetical protein
MHWGKYKYFLRQITKISFKFSFTCKNILGKRLGVEAKES